MSDTENENEKESPALQTKTLLFLGVIAGAILLSILILALMKKEPSTKEEAELTPPVIINTTTTPLPQEAVSRQDLITGAVLGAQARKIDVQFCYSKGGIPNDEKTLCCDPRTCPYYCGTHVIEGCSRSVITPSCDNPNSTLQCTLTV